MSSRYDIVIVGGGIVGLATALKLLERRPGLKLGVLEKESLVGTHQTGNNSGVIHSGLYYKPGSAKAKTCVQGAQRMVSFCLEHGIAHEICGKVVVATNEAELPALAELHRRGVANGVPGIEEIGAERLREIEPHAAGIKALWVPGTGIVDYGAVARKYAELIQKNGGVLQTGVRVLGIQQGTAGLSIVRTSAGDIETRLLINCGGLHSDRIARMSGASPGARIVPFRGEYYKLTQAAQNLVRGLIYPVPDPRFPFLGVHFTRMIGGGVECGPNAVLALKREGYSKLSFSVRDAVETLTYRGFLRLAKKYWRTGAGEMWRSVSKAAFVQALQKLLPEIRSEHLEPGGAGVRAQALLPDGSMLDDFRIVRDRHAIHVLNAPSPAATASLCIGEQIAALAEQD
ncbi:MAG TPA: L-2-hydroxyglutarate oxidase [Planctomycetota bacterium]|nr:L-2-hydroxyglutarate oxidase [Planctomycetota bacterium]